MKGKATRVSSGRQSLVLTHGDQSLPDQDGLVTIKRNKGYDTKDMAFNLFKKKGKKKDEEAAAEAEADVSKLEDESKTEEIAEGSATVEAADASPDQAEPEKTGARPR